MSNDESANESIDSTGSLKKLEDKSINSSVSSKKSISKTKKSSKSKYSTSTPNHGSQFKIKYLNEEILNNSNQTITTVNPKDVLSKFFVNPIETINPKDIQQQDTDFDSTFTIDSNVIKQKTINISSTKSILSPLKNEVKMNKSGSNKNADTATIAATTSNNNNYTEIEEAKRMTKAPFDVNEDPLSLKVTEEILDSDLIKISKTNNLPINLNFRQWSLAGLQRIETENNLIKKLILNRFKLIKRFEFLNNLVNLYAKNLNENEKVLVKKIEKLKSLSNEIINNI